MDAEQLAAMLTALENDDLRLKPDGTLVNNETDGEFAPADVLTVLDEMQTLAIRLRAIAEWAKKAPEVGG